MDICEEEELQEEQSEWEAFAVGAEEWSAEALARRMEVETSPISAVEACPVAVEACPPRSLLDQAKGVCCGAGFPPPQVTLCASVWQDQWAALRR